MSQLITIIEAVEIAKLNQNAVFIETEGGDHWDTSCLIEAHNNGEIGENGSIPENREVVVYDSEVELIEEEWSEAESYVEIETKEEFDQWANGDKHENILTAIYEGTRYMKRGEWGNLTMWWEIPGGWAADGGSKALA